MPNKQLTAKVRLNAKDAEKSIDNLVKKIDRLNNVTNKAANAGNQNKYYAKTQRQVDSITNRVKAWANAQKQVTSSTKSTNAALSAIGSKLKWLASTYLGVMGAKAVTGATDVLVGAQNRLNYVAPDQFDSASATMYATAQGARTSYQDMMSNVSKSMILAGDAFDNNIDYAIRFQEVMAKAYAVGGASAAEMSSSMYQLNQALGSGVLQGDELRSVREGAPLAYQAIEKFAQGVLKTDESLKDLASDGLITSEMVVAAVMDMGKGIDEAFANTRQTFGQTFDQILNSALYAFQPVMEMLSDALNNAIDNGMIPKFESFFTFVSKGIMILFTLISDSVTWVAEHWDLLNRIWATTGTIITALLIPKFVAWAKTAIVTTLTTLAGIWADIVAFIELAKAEGLAATMAGLFGITINWWLIAIIAVIAAVVIAVIWMADSFADACGMIVGGIAAAGAFIWNLLVGLINGIVQLVWGALVVPVLGYIEWMLNVAIGGFDSFGGAVANLIGNIISWFLSLGQVVTTIIDAIFGTNWTSGLESLKSSVLKWGKNEHSITLSREAPTVMSRLEYGNAYSAGYDWASSKVNSLSVGGLLDGIGNSLGLDFSDMTTPFPSDGVNSAYSPDMEKLLKGIGDDTGKIADSMDLTSEDLEYLRRVADMEWKKEFTTAQIKIDMTNNNQINGESDLDGIVTKLADKLYEEMNVIADGVYA